SRGRAGKATGASGPARGAARKREVDLGRRLRSTAGPVVGVVAARRSGCRPSRILRVAGDRRGEGRADRAGGAPEVEPRAPRGSAGLRARLVAGVFGVAPASHPGGDG